ncbi:hypothetical protein O9993_11490 [Vibrio lentus]|nr:hypothetical protein [Vibrio lentus]
MRFLPANLDTEVSIRGKDEVTQMAKYLKVFQTTAKVVKQTNRKLEAEVEERNFSRSQTTSNLRRANPSRKLAALGATQCWDHARDQSTLTAVNSHVRSAFSALVVGKQRPDRAEENLKKSRSC